MKEQAILKINKIGKVSTIMAIICKILLILGLVVSTVGMILCLVMPKDWVKVTNVGTTKMEIDYGALGIEVFGDEMSEAEELNEWIAQGKDVQVSTVQSGMNGFSMSARGQDYTLVNMSVKDGVITQEMTSGEVSLTIRDVAVLMGLTMVAVAMTLVTVIFIEGLCKAFRDCQSPFDENVIQKMQHLAIALIPWTVVSSIAESALTSAMTNHLQWNFQLDMGIVLVVLIVLILTYIFKYGAVLQQESDETL